MGWDVAHGQQLLCLQHVRNERPSITRRILSRLLQWILPATRAWGLPQLSVPLLKAALATKRAWFSWQAMMGLHILVRLSFWWVRSPTRGRTRLGFWA